MLGVGGAATIPEKYEFTASADGGSGALRKFSDARDQRVRKGLLDAGAFRQLAPNFVDVRGHVLLTQNNFRAVTNHPAGGVARVDDVFRGVHDRSVVVAGMIGGDQDSVVLAERLGIQGNGFHVGVVVVAHFVELREVGIVVIETGAALFEDFHDFQGWGFAQVVHVFFVGHAEDENPGAAKAFLMHVQRFGDGIDDVVRHGGVDFAREFDETRGEIVLARFPGKIERVHRNAVAAEAGAGIERHEAEGLGGSGVDHFPDVDTHAKAEEFEFVDESDVHAAEDVFEELGHFGGAGSADGNDASDDLPVKRDRRAAAGRIDAADDFGNLRQAELLVAGIFALGRKREEEIERHVFVFGAGSDRAAEAALFENRENEFFGSAGIGGGFENDQLAADEIRLNGFSGVFDVTQVGLAIFVQWRGDANDDGVSFRELGEIGDGVEVAAVHELLDFRLGDVLDVGPAGVQHANFFGIGVESSDLVAGFSEAEGEREADVATSNNGDFQLAAFEELGSSIRSHEGENAPNP